MDVKREGLKDVKVVLLQWWLALKVEQLLLR